MTTAETILGLSTEGIKFRELVTQMIEMLRSHTGEARRLQGENGVIGI